MSYSNGKGYFLVPKMLTKEEAIVVAKATVGFDVTEYEEVHTINGERHGAMSHVTEIDAAGTLFRFTVCK